MKRLIFILVIFLIGMTAFGQDLSFFAQEYNRADATFAERHLVLETLRDAGITAPNLNAFYHSALRLLLSKSPDISSTGERAIAERSIVILAEALGAARFQEAAWDLWQAAELFDVFGNATDGNAQQAALTALGQIGNKAVLPNLVLRLSEYNLQPVRNAEQRRRVNMAVIGFISALEAFKDISGFRPVFFASVGPYDQTIRNIAIAALPNIVDDPSEAMIPMIREPGTDPATKLQIWRELNRTRMPDSSKAKVAAAALEVGWAIQTANRTHQTALRELRKGALEIIRQFGVSADSVYADLERSYVNNFENSNPDYDEIMLALNALTAVNTEQSVRLLYNFLNGINGRRRVGPWGNKERRCFEWIVSCLGATRTQMGEVRILLLTISRNTIYTPQEREMAARALSAITG
ncbi:MAG: hypothetical protein FWC01_09660 [Treponema sp.]|nr:hypothetical protein [Treponema sp.]